MHFNVGVHMEDGGCHLKFLLKCDISELICYEVDILQDQKAPQGGCGHRRQHVRLR